MILFPTEFQELDARYLNGSFTPQDYGWLAWAFDPLLAYGAAPGVAGYSYFTLVPVRRGGVASNVIMYVGTAGASLTAGQNLAGLFDKNGNLLSATADQSTSWQSTGLKVMPLLAPQNLTPDLYFVGYYANGSTMPQFSYNAAANNMFAAAALSPPRFGLDFASGQRTTAFQAKASMVPQGAAWWAAIS